MSETIREKLDEAPPGEGGREAVKDILEDLLDATNKWWLESGDLDDYVGRILALSQAPGQRIGGYVDPDMFRMVEEHKAEGRQLGLTFTSFKVLESSEAEWPATLIIHPEPHEGGKP